MSHEIPPVQSTKVEPVTTEDDLPVSPEAYQVPSAGPLLPSTSWGVADWAWFLISFQWVTALFTSSKPVDTSRATNVHKLFEHAKALLVGRIPLEESRKICQWMQNQASPEWLATFATFLKEAERLEDLKPEQFPFYGEQETQVLINLLTKLFSECSGVTYIEDLLREITFLTTTSEIDPIQATLENWESSSHLHSISACPYALQFEIRADTQTLLITDPCTKATRSIQFDPTKPDEHHLQLAKAIHDLSSPKLVGGNSTPDTIKSAIKGGNVYAIPHAKGVVLSLSTRSTDLHSSAFFPDKAPIQVAKNLILEGKESELEMPILLTTEKVHVKPELLDNNMCRVTFTFNAHVYQTYYSLQEGENLTHLASRIALDHTLERDLLLARSFFARTLP